MTQLEHIKTVFIYTKIVYSICHLQDDDKQDVMDVVENDKQVYLFYQPPYQNNTD